MLTFTFDWIQVLTFLVAIFLPLLVGLVTKVVTHPGTRAILLALLSAVIGFLSELLTALQTQSAFDVGAALITWLGIFVVAVATHFGIWKPTGVSTKAQAAFNGNPQ
jgi:hypothetical protein